MNRAYASLSIHNKWITNRSVFKLPTLQNYLINRFNVINQYEICLENLEPKLNGTDWRITVSQIFTLVDSFNKTYKDIPVFLDNVKNLEKPSDYPYFNSCTSKDKEILQAAFDRYCTASVSEFNLQVLECKLTIDRIEDNAKRACLTIENSQATNDVQEQLRNLVFENVKIRQELDNLRNQINSNQSENIRQNSTQTDGQPTFFGK